MIELDTELRDFFGGRDTFDSILNANGKIFREHKNRKTLYIKKDGKGYFLKIHHRAGWKEIFKNLISLRVPVLGAGNELRAIRRLEELGIDTMKVVGFGQRGLPPAWIESFIITRELENTTSLEDLSRDWRLHPPDFTIKSALIAEIAEIARRLHENGVNHRDFYICHFLLDLKHLKEKEDLRLYLIDLHRVQMRKNTPERWRIKDIAGLYFSSMDTGLTRRDLFRFMKAYRGKPLRTILKDEEGFWSLVSDRAVSLYRKNAA
jgi:heptose I phosphotransferase